MVRLPSTDDIKETTWKWRCKMSSIGKSNEKTLSDFSSNSSSEDLKAQAKGSTSSKEPGFGGSASIKTLYEGKDSTATYYDWVDYPPRQISKSVAKVHDRVAFKVYKVKDPEKPVISGKFALRYHRIDVQNPLLVAALEPILKKEDMHLDANETAVFNAPFRQLYFCYDDIVAKHRSLAPEDPLGEFILLFIRLLDDVFSEIRAKRSQLRGKGLVAFNHLWTHFPRDTIVISHANNTDVLSKVVSTFVKSTPGCDSTLSIQCKVLSFNGDAFVWNETSLEIPAFGGNRPMTELSHYPLDFHKDAKEIKAKMTARGRMVLDYQGLTYCMYKGVGIFQQGMKYEKHNVDCRILIDVVGYNRHHLQQGPREGKNTEVSNNTVKGTGRKIDDDSVTENQPEKPLGPKHLTEDEQNLNKQIMLANPHDLMFMAPLIEGYALKNKLWLSFYVEDIKPMIWNEKAYEHLVYNEEQKDLVLSFVESHGHTKSRVQDVIMGKGEGLIILLSGPPGTGKTLTAEAVADKTKRPLFYLQAEDLGISAAVLGSNIKKVFEMATEWNAVILLDEADVFMAERHPQDIARNELVSIFLRELEYFRGIVFLTTNMYDTIDSAFRSRVSLHLLFKQLTPAARLTVWQKFLDRLPTTEQSAQIEDSKRDVGGDLTDDDLKELSGWNLNGREIKTAVKMVKSWCDHKGYDLTLARLENGIRVTSPHAAKMSNSLDTDLYD